ncbi:DUF2523 domain-containing protein [Glaciimonas immobilis]|uniref:DUF2523 domain-containing protein n=1 Tax=Glaciimonas immobilis TaxID=728004 RepID=A0A840RPM5_9BURK|nr:DUF2523 domain-containing protein [Glaciimonas immobilis]KAF3999447.1 DUF2523 domain-containing protein [Glaciimonas immobilis]MBB5198956.1 hypothetical protein [Glaciimonas immobilis]
MGWTLLINAIWGALAPVLGSLVGRILLALGISFLTYTGLSYGVDAIKLSVISSFGGLSADVIGFIGYLWVDKAITTVFSAFATALAIKVGTGSSITKMVVK